MAAALNRGGGAPVKEGTNGRAGELHRGVGKLVGHSDWGMWWQRGWFHGELLLARVVEERRWLWARKADGFCLL